MNCSLFRDPDKDGEARWRWVLYRRKGGEPICHSGSQSFPTSQDAMADALRRLPPGVTIEIEDLSQWAM